ncbi:MAG: bifunctional phosphatase PAP2/diacylglycerol kinase family protein [Actinomycetota bacterium]
MPFMRSLRKNPVKKADHALFRKLAAVRSPGLDKAMYPLSRAADRSKIWLVVGGILALTGGRFGRRAAMRGLLALGITSGLVNGPLKLASRRRRPSNPTQRTRVLRREPASASFPSGHSASAFAFATGVALESPRYGIPLAAAAGAVALSRVYTGVHYPADVLVGGAVGAAVAVGTTKVWPRAPHEAAANRTALARVGGDAFPDGQGITFVVNPDSGPALIPKPTGQLQEAFPEAQILELSEDLDLGAALKIAAQARAIGIAGGDGSVNAAAEVAVHQRLPLIVVPSGTLNHLARDLGLGSVKDSIEAVVNGEVAAVDVASIDGRPFLNTASFGSYADLVDARELLESKIGKWPALVVALVKILRTSSPSRVEINGQEQSVWMIFIGNCRYHPQGFAPAWRERLDDGLIDVRTVDGQHPWARTRLVLALMTGTLARSRVYHQNVTRRLEVRFLDEGPVRLARDGETFDGSSHFVVEKTLGPVPIYVRAAASDEGP